MQTPLDINTEEVATLDERPRSTLSADTTVAGNEPLLTVEFIGLVSQFSAAELEVIETYMADILDEVLG